MRGATFDVLLDDVKSGSLTHVRAFIFDDLALVIGRVVLDDHISADIWRGEISTLVQGEDGFLRLLFDVSKRYLRELIFKIKYVRHPEGIVSALILEAGSCYRNLS